MRCEAPAEPRNDCFPTWLVLLPRPGGGIRSRTSIQDPGFALPRDHLGRGSGCALRSTSELRPWPLSPRLSAGTVLRHRSDRGSAQISYGTVLAHYSGRSVEPSQRAARPGSAPHGTEFSAPPRGRRRDKAFRDGWPRAARNSGPSGAQAPQELVARSAVGSSGIVRNDESGRDLGDFSAGIVLSDHSGRPKVRWSAAGLRTAGSAGMVR